MSKTSKFSLLFSGLFTISVFVARLILGGWNSMLWLPLGLAIVCFAFAVLRDWRMFLEFFSLRTTKHGMNMGALIMSMIVFLIAVNFLAVSKDKKWDWTSEGINSLSEQSLKVVENLQTDTDLVLLYRIGENDETTRRQVTEVANYYSSASKKFHLKVYNALERPDLSQKYGYTSGPYGLYLTQSTSPDGKGERHVKVELPTEEEVTRALLRFSRDKKKFVYFVSGHGEHDITLSGPESVSQFKHDLEVFYEVRSLELSKSPKVPMDADVVIVAGPRQAYLPAEIDALRDFAKRGGHLFLAIDPGVGHGLASLTKTFGVEFQNNFLLDARATIPGAGNIAVLGHVFSKQAESTKQFRSGFTLFYIASALKKSPDAPKEFKIDEIIRSTEDPVASSELRSDAGVQIPGPHTLAIESKGRLSGSGPAEIEKEFDVIVVGDGDFLRDNLYRSNLNRDFAVNAVASLAKDAELVSIRPKVPAGTKLEMPEQKLLILLFGFLLPVPIILFFTGGLLWWRRKAA